MVLLVIYVILFKTFYFRFIEGAIAQYAIPYLCGCLRRGSL